MKKSKLNWGIENERELKIRFFPLTLFLQSFRQLNFPAMYSSQDRLESGCPNGVKTVSNDPVQKHHFPLYSSSSLSCSLSSPPPSTSTATAAYQMTWDKPAWIALEM